MDIDDSLRLLVYEDERSLEELAEIIGMGCSRLRNWYYQRRREDTQGLDTMNEFQIMRLAEALGYEVVLRPTGRGPTNKPNWRKPRAALDSNGHK